VADNITSTMWQVLPPMADSELPKGVPLRPLKAGISAPAKEIMDRVFKGSKDLSEQEEAVLCSALNDARTFLVCFHGGKRSFQAYLRHAYPNLSVVQSNKCLSLASILFTSIASQQDIPLPESVHEYMLIDPGQMWNCEKGQFERVAPVQTMSPASFAWLSQEQKKAIRQWQKEQCGAKDDTTLDMNTDHWETAHSAAHARLQLRLVCGMAPSTAAHDKWR